MSKTDTKNYNEFCLFFSASSLARSINEMTEQAFQSIGISASYGHLMLLVIDIPNQKLGELSKQMNVKSSTMTRFIDKLEAKGFVQRDVNGRTVSIAPTPAGIKLRPKIMEALKVLYLNYCEKLGEEFAIQLTADIHVANTKLF